MKGYIKKNCYKIVGYLSDFKQRKRFGAGNSDGWKPPRGRSHEGWRKEPLAAANSADVASTSQTTRDNHKAIEHKKLFFTREQYNQILILLNKDSGDHHANIAGISICLMSNI